MNSLLSLDDVRAAFPRLGLALYAYEPGGPVTLEVYATDGQTFSFTGATQAAVLTRAFPSLAQPAPEPTAPEQPHNVFD